GEDRDHVADLYLIVERYGPAYSNPLLALANRILPPNVFYIETPFEDRLVRAKYAIVALPHLERLVRPQTLQSYFWARFAQPMRLLWARDPESRARIVGALVQAVTTTAGESRALVDRPGELFGRAFRESYASELRSEGAERAAALSRFDQERYARLAEALLGPKFTKTAAGHRARRRAAARWQRRRLIGKTLSVLRLMKGAFTFKDGARYLLWKIERHSGVRHDLTPWQRRHPILASSVLFWQLYRKGAFR
ncbi:MAG: hypothetical protein R3285_02850, partial [Kiloniellales bacterium]|nr:hypothetical protein [Kiloniellales bacterium]